MFASFENDKTKALEAVLVDIEEKLKSESERLKEKGNEEDAKNITRIVEDVNAAKKDVESTSFKKIRLLSFVFLTKGGCIVVSRPHGRALMSYVM